MTHRLPGQFTLPAAAAVMLIGSVEAATINWQTPVDISAPTDISTNGTGVLAFNANNDGVTQTVNGVAFGNDGAGSDRDNDYAYTVNGATVTSLGFDGNFSPFDDFGAPPGITGDYADLLNSGIYAVNTDSVATIRFDGLTIGQAYEVQVLINDSRLDLFNRTVNLDGDPVTNVAYHQSVIGTFVADSTTQDIDFSDSSSEDPQYNAVQLREVPEPGTLALCAIGATMMIRRRR